MKKQIIIERIQAAFKSIKSDKNAQCVFNVHAMAEMQSTVSKLSENACFDECVILCNDIKSIVNNYITFECVQSIYQKTINLLAELNALIDSYETNERPFIFYDDEPVCELKKRLERHGYRLSSKFINGELCLEVIK